MTALAVFLAVGATVATSTAAALLLPGSALDVIWKLNPPVRAEFATLHGWAPLLMALVATLCAAAAYGLWAGRKWGRALAITLFAVELVSDVGLASRRPSTLIGVPISLLVLVYLVVARRPRAFFDQALAGKSSAPSTQPGHGT